MKLYSPKRITVAMILPKQPVLVKLSSKQDPGLVIRHCRVVSCRSASLHSHTWLARADTWANHTGNINQGLWMFSFLFTLNTIYKMPYLPFLNIHFLLTNERIRITWYTKALITTETKDYSNQINQTNHCF